MNRRKFIGIAGGTVLVSGGAAYLLSDKSNLERADIKPANKTDATNETLLPDEKEILFLASLAPSGHNTQPWFVQRLAPFHWIIGSDKSKWLPAVDPAQREIRVHLARRVRAVHSALPTLTPKSATDISPTGSAQH